MATKHRVQVEVEVRIANRVRELRERQGISQAELARLAKTSRSQVANVERGDRAITVSTLNLFASALRVRLADLLGEDPLPEERPDRAGRIAATLRERGPAYVAAVDALLVSLDRVVEAGRATGSAAATTATSRRSR